MNAIKSFAEHLSQLEKNGNYDPDVRPIFALLSQEILGTPASGFPEIGLSLVVTGENVAGPWVTTRAILLAFSIAGDTKDTTSPPNNLMQRAFSLLSNSIGALNSELRTEVRRGREAHSTDLPGFSEAANQTLRFANLLANQTSRVHTIAPRHILAALILSHLKRARRASERQSLEGIPIERWIRTLVDHIITHHQDDDNIDQWYKLCPFFNETELSRNVSGDHLALRRTASSEEIGLDAQKYASVIAELFRLADDDEFSMAIYGAWGRGKTFLMDLAAKAMAEDHIVVKFSAWKYPSAPEVWIHLYETLAREAWDKRDYTSLSRIFRTGIARNGWYPLIAPFMAISFAAIPLTSYLDEIWTAFTVAWLSIGIGGIFFLASTVIKIRSTAFELKQTYLQSSRHHEKLGLQATIGTDLQLLLRGWVRPQVFTTTSALLYSFTFIALACSLMYRFHTYPPAAMLAFVLVLTNALLFLFFIEHKDTVPARIILVVDDLDRCEPSHLINVVESIRLLSEDPEICARMKLVFLVEEDILIHAIEAKYGRLLQRRGRNSFNNRFVRNPRQLILDNIEKLFTVHLRLGPLRKVEIEDLVRRFSGGTRPIALPSSINEGRETAPEISPSLVPLSVSGQANTDEYNVLPTVHDPGAALTEADRGAILMALGIQSGDELVPRSIRAFIFRYQLARLLVKELGIAWDPSLLAITLAHSRTT